MTWIAATKVLGLGVEVCLDAPDPLHVGEAEGS